MRRIIDSKAYDTGKAHRVGAWDNGLLTTDFDYVAETLYRKRTGEYFIHGSGGALSIYSESRGNGERIGTDELIPLSYGSAKAWAEKRLAAEVYEAEFGKQTEGRGAIAVSMDAAVIDTLRAIAAEKGCSLSAEVERRLKQSLAS